MKNGEKKEKRIEVKIPMSLHHKIVLRQIETYQKTGKKPSIGSLVREALRASFK